MSVATSLDERLVTRIPTFRGGEPVGLTISSLEGMVRRLVERSNMLEKRWHLASCDLFDGLPSTHLARLEACSRTTSFPIGAAIYLPSEEADTVYLLAKGLVKVCHLTDDGKQSILGFVEPSEPFGESALFASGQRGEYVEVLEPAVVVVIPADELKHLISQHHELAAAITRLVGIRRQRIERRLKNLLFLSNHDRLVHLLLDLAEQFGTTTDDGIALRVRLSHQELANQIGSTRETITILLGQLKAQGLVGGGRRRIVLTDPERLAQSVNRTATLGTPSNTRLVSEFLAG